MSKILKKIILILLVSILLLSNCFNTVMAAFEISDAYIQKIGEAPYHLKYYQEAKGMDTYAICSIVGYYKDGNFYPAYCLNRDLHGVGAVDNYSVDIDSLIDDNQVWRVVKNGYPYKTASEMGVWSDFDAFAVTKFAVYCVTGQADINLYSADDGDAEGQAMLQALHNLVDIGLYGTDTFNEEIKINKYSEFIEDGDYYSVLYNVSAKNSISEYKIEKIEGLNNGDLITDENGNVKTIFNNNENFKVKILKSNLNSDKNININISAKLKSYPIFYGKTRIQGTQNYLLTANEYNNINKNVNLKLKLNTGKIQIVKTDEETKEGIEGVEFELFNSNNKSVGKAVTNKEGKAYFSNLYQGKYYLKETKTNEKYVLDENKKYDVNVNYNKTSTINIENEHKKGNITISKIDKDNKEIALGNVGFELYNTDTSKLIGTYYTNQDGEIKISNLRIGNYKIKEISTNQWYNLADDKNVKVTWNKTNKVTIENELKKGQIRVIKVDKDNNEIKLKGVKFEVKDTKGNVLETITTDEKGEALTSKYALRDYNSIIIHEIETNKNYKLNENISEIKLEENQIKSIKFENEKKKGQIKVIKVDKDNHETKIPNVKFNVMDEQGNIIESIITNNDGEAITKLLPIDKEYKIQEIETNEIYKLSDEVKTVKLEENQIKNIEFENEKKKGQIKVIKVDKENHEVKLKDVEFEVLNEQGLFVEKLVTDDNGEAISSLLPIDQNYILKENKTGENYVLSEEPQTVEIEENQIKNIVFENEKIKGKIKIIKTADKDSTISGIKQGDPIEGVKFEIYDRQNNLVDTVTTNNEGIAYTKSLDKGIYNIKEIETNEYFLLDEKIQTVRITKNNEITTINLRNKPATPDEEIKKTGPNVATANEEIEYNIEIKNTGNVDLDNFTWEDEVPTDYIRITKINLGTFNQENKYNLYYKTNLNDEYVLLLENISTKNSEVIDLKKELADNEYITNLKLEFGTVEKGFQTENTTKLYAIVNDGVANNSEFENKVNLKSNYKGYNLEKTSKWKTKIYKILPLTGM